MLKNKSIRYVKAESHKRIKLKPSQLQILKNRTNVESVEDENL
jgi:hypothetical protein